MSLAADALQPYVVRGPISLSGRVARMTLSDALTPTKAGYDLEVVGRAISIDFRQPEFLTRIVAADSCRFVSASFQTLACVTKEIAETNTLPWALIKLYYAAFYAGHALIRLFGESCSHFNQKQLTQINAFAASLGKSSVEIGLYHCVISASAAELRAQGMTGGAHELFWEIFGDWIGRSQERLSRGLGSLSLTQAQEVLLKLGTLRDIVRGARLSGLRNSVQYRHDFGVWFPTKLRKHDREALSRLASQWNRDPMMINLRVPHIGALGEFVIACSFIIALCRTMLNRIAERSTVGKRSFVHFGPLDILSEAEGSV